ncbi:MAG: hypothetical protein IJV34_02230, partial [Prevotella sp.]|nr:hypothetical protein [Prevotella sp.]
SSTKRQVTPFPIYRFPFPFCFLPCKRQSVERLPWGFGIKLPRTGAKIMKNMIRAKKVDENLFELQTAAAPQNVSRLNKLVA